MLSTRPNCFFSYLIQSLVLLAATPTGAQIIPDNSLPVDSTVIHNGNVIIIDGGTAAQKNLFHSFEAFSLSSGQIAVFNNNVNIQNIFSRVTGSSISNINGVLAANGEANLFFLNPNGIILGRNAGLGIGGSFFATSANRIIFADGFELKGSSSPSLLTVSSRSPSGLGFNNNPGKIVVQGSGHQLGLSGEFSLDNLFVATPILGGGQSSSGLRTAPGKTLGLIGGKIILEGGLLTAFSGKIELGSVEGGIVQLNVSNSQFSLNYDQISQFQDIRLEQKALLDASGFSKGQINLQARNVSILDGAAIIVSHFGDAPSGAINIGAIESVNLVGVNDFKEFSVQNLDSNNIIRGIFTQTLSDGKGADITVSARDLSIKNLSTLNAVTFGSAEGGSIQLKVQENFFLDGNNPLNFFLPSSIISLGTGSGKAGDVLMSGKKLLIQGGGLILSQTLGLGAGGDVTISISDSVEISGAIPTDLLGSEISSTIGSVNLLSGNPGEVAITTQNLKVASGGLINTNTTASGNAGNIIINANLIELVGNSQISSSADQPNAFLSGLFNLPEFPSGNSGSLSISTNDLNILDGGLISVINEGTGDGGVIEINASAILLNQGNISAETFSGQGGNIQINSDNITLLKNSNVAATAGGRGAGGNIEVTTDLLLVSDQSLIAANALLGSGGNISINGDTILSSDSIISASSELGLDGEVKFNGEIFQIQNLTSLPVNFSPEVLLSRSCFAGKPARVSFTWEGPGGVPLSDEVGAFSIPLSENPGTQQGISLRPPQSMRLATRLVRTEDGRLFLLGDGGDWPAAVGAGQKCDD